MTQSDTPSTGTDSLWPRVRLTTAAWPAATSRGLVVKDDGVVIPHADRVASDLETRGVRVRVGDRVDVSFGRRVTDWELRGAPLRVTLGHRA